MRWHLGRWRVPECLVVVIFEIELDSWKNGRRGASCHVAVAFYYISSLLCHRSRFIYLSNQELGRRSGSDCFWVVGINPLSGYDTEYSYMVPAIYTQQFD